MQHQTHEGPARLRVRTVRALVFAAADVEHESRRLERAAERLNRQFAGLLRLELTCHSSYPERCRPRASDFDIVLAILWSRLSDEAPAEPGLECDTADAGAEAVRALTATASDKLPAVFVFRKTERPHFPIDDAAALEHARREWTRLESFFEHDLAKKNPGSPAYFRFGTPDEFDAKSESVLREWVEQHLPAARAPSWSITLNGSPFPGLAPFDLEHASVFFGRARETAHAIDRFIAAARRQTAFLLVLGPSGAGKSSLVRAGVVPRLTSPGVVPEIDLWRLALLRPDAKPIEALAQALLAPSSKGRPGALAELTDGDQKTTSTQLVELLRRGDEAALIAIRHALDLVGMGERRHGGSEPRARAALLLVVDELDDLFAAEISAADRALFCRLMRTLANSGVVWVAATLRAALHETLMEEDDLKRLKEDGAEYDLGLPGPAELAEIVRRPAAAADLTFETQDEALDARLLRDLMTTPSLALLQFTLQRLFVERQLAGSERRLTHAAYVTVGGLAGAIDHVAERAIIGLGANAIDALPALLRRLVTPVYRPSLRVTSGAPLTLRTAMLADLDTPMRRLVDALVQAGLLVHSIERGVPTIRLAHLEVLEYWQRARAIMAAMAVGPPPSASPPSRWRERISTVMTAALAALAVLAGWLYFDARRGQHTVDKQHKTALLERDHADRGRGIAERREQEARELRDLWETRGRDATERARLAEAARAAAVEQSRLAEAGREQALTQARLAESRGTTAEAERAIAQQRQEAAEVRAQETDQRARAAQSRLLAELADHKSRIGDHVTAVLFALEAVSTETGGDRSSPAQRSLERAWHAWSDERIPRERLFLDDARGPVLACALSPNGSRAAIGGADGIVQLWDAETGAALVRLVGHSEGVEHVSFDAEAIKIISAAADGLRVSDAATGAQIAWLPEKRRVLAVSSDGRWVISSSAPNRLHLWDANAEREIIRTVPGAVLAVRLGTEGARVLVATGSGSIELYEAFSGRWLRSFRGHARRVLTASFSPDGRFMASLGDDQTARIWSTANGRQLFSVYDHTLKPALPVALTNEHVLIPFSFGLRLYAIQGARLVAQLPVENETSTALVSPDATYMVTVPSSEDDANAPKHAKLWETATGKPLAILQDGVPTTCAALSQKAGTLLTGDREGVGRIWSFERAGGIASTAPVASIIEASKAQIPRCLTRAQREIALLEVEPPAWCIEGAKRPYHTQAWKDWLRYKRANAGPPLPDTPQWRAWLAHRPVAPPAAD